MRVALAFRRPDVDAFLDEVDHEQYAEWCAYFDLEPHGWPALQMAVTRLAYVAAMTAGRGKRRIRERDFLLQTAAAQVHSDRGELARWEAMAVRQEIVAGREG